MAHLTGVMKDEVSAETERHAREAALCWNAVVALGRNVVHRHARRRLLAPRRRPAGLGTSGSGDVLAGIIVGLAARGAPLEQAAVWGVALHARAGQALAERLGPIGYLARELPAQIPMLLDQLAH
jgi:NAD(P)H-hydrate repair Nnr-like enzyme with NAD(P)H-hydrate dehydratase domain